MSINCYRWNPYRHYPACLYFNGHTTPIMTEKAKPDRRIERTRNALWDALFALLHSRSWEDINVRMICDQANVARSSFYLHFQNKLELLDYGFDSGLEQARDAVEAGEYRKGEFNTFDWLVDHVCNGHEVFENGWETNDVIFARFRRAVSQLLQDELSNRNMAVPPNSLAFVIGGAFGILANWTNNQCQEKPQVILNLLNTHASAVLTVRR